MKAGSVVAVVAARDDDARESYLRVFATAEKAKRDLERWQAKRKGHDLYAGAAKRRVV